MTPSVLTLPWRIATFAAWFLGELVQSTRAVLADALRSGSAATPRVVRLPVEGTSTWQVVLISMLITMTPGTLTLGLAAATREHPRSLLVHSMYHEDSATALEDLEDMFTRMRHALAVGRSAP